ncbi:Trp biosynthesis-associated membrane protein [Mycetocola sp. 2940]|uniref:Trp biosynthesis-associated membrane protein n=1 Tax=Mycetocola sp. 2940 TaxID=3156452 RepID=UPI003391FBC8
MTPEPRPSKRAKYGLILASLLLSGFALIAWTQTWLTVELEAGAPTTTVAVDGAIAAPALAALALAGLALSAALAIAGLLFRILLGVLDILLGGCIALSAVLVLRAPVAASEAAVTDVTGIAGADSIAGLVSATSLTLWPAIALATGILLAIVGVGVVLTAKRWPSSPRKYSAVRLEPVDSDAMPDSVDSWDDLTRGDDPTR